MNWQPIETAPKDGTAIVAYCPRLGVCAPTSWNDDKYSKNPKPYWRHWVEHIFRVRCVREDQSTHWMPLPPPPEGKKP
jgi:hypothetical protein